jgi:hypothetical protein
MKLVSYETALVHLEYQHIISFYFFFVVILGKELRAFVVLLRMWNNVDGHENGIV